MSKDHQKRKNRQQFFLLKIIKKQIENFHVNRVWIQHPDPVCIERLDPDLKISNRII